MARGYDDGGWKAKGEWSSGKGQAVQKKKQKPQCEAASKDQAPGSTVGMKLIAVSRYGGVGSEAQAKAKQGKSR